MPWRIIYRQRSVLIANSTTRFRLSIHQLVDYFTCNKHIIEFHANYTPFCFSTQNLCVRSVIRYGSAKSIALQTGKNLVYIPMRIAFRLLHLRKMLRNNVLIFINMQLGITQKPVAL